MAAAAPTPVPRRLSAARLGDTVDGMLLEYFGLAVGAAILRSTPDEGETIPANPGGEGPSDGSSLTSWLFDDLGVSFLLQFGAFVLIVCFIGYAIASNGPQSGPGSSPFSPGDPGSL